MVGIALERPAFRDHFDTVESAEQNSLFEDPPAQGSGERSGADGGHRPLAVRMRPQGLGGVVGQQHILGADCLLPRLIRADSFGSLFFYGPPGSGKTTLAEVIARETASRFVRVNAVMSNVGELREILRFARARPELRTLLFIDEIHRFNKAQQDLLLPDVEEGSIRLIGATTHNPGFYINAPLLSRSHLFRLEPVAEKDTVCILERALEDEKCGLGARRCTADAGALRGLARLCDGDLRRALNALETLVFGLPLRAHLREEDVGVFARERQIRYDADEDEHYDTISAYIKSMRGGDPDAALYWLAKMLEGGEEPRFIARRLVILASEDVGMADPRALPLATAAFQAVEFVGLPECEYALAHATVFLATCPKSNRAGAALHAAREAIRNEPVQAVPMALRDASTRTNKAFGHGKAYRYSHDYPEAISGEDYMERPRGFYEPGSHGAEAAVAERLARWRALKHERQAEMRERDVK